MQLKNINTNSTEECEVEMSLRDFLNTSQVLNRQSFVDGSGGNESSASSGVYKPVPPPKPVSPPYRMPPQPPGAPSLYGEPPIPGAATASEAPLRTHSAKYPIERELVLSAEKGSSKIPLMHEPRNAAGPPRRSAVGLPLMPRSAGSIAPDHPPKQIQAWNSHQHVTVQIDSHQTTNQSSLNASSAAAAGSLTGAIPRTPARLPEDVTALAADSAGGNARTDGSNKNAVTKTYHTLKDLISGKFKKDHPDSTSTDELNNVVLHHQQQHQQQQQQQQQQQLHQQQPQSTQTGTTGITPDEDYRSPYSALPVHMRQMQGLQSQPNIWTGKTNGEPNHGGNGNTPSTLSGGPRPFGGGAELPRGVQQRAISQPQLNMPSFASGSDRRGSLANIDVTDSDEGGFASSRTMMATPTAAAARRPPPPATGVFAMQTPNGMRNSPQSFQLGYQQQQTSSPYVQSPFHHSHGTGAAATATPMFSSSFAQQQQQQLAAEQMAAASGSSAAAVHHLNGSAMYTSTPVAQSNAVEGLSSESMQARHDALRASFHKQLAEIHQQSADSAAYQQTPTAKLVAQRNVAIRSQQQQQQQQQQQTTAATKAALPGSAGSSDYDKSGTHSSNVDSGRGSAAYSSGRKQSAALDAEHNAEVAKRLSKANGGGGGGVNSNDDTEWVDIVDAELRHILEPGMQSLGLRGSLAAGDGGGSTVSGSASSMSPPLPPLSPGGSSYKPIASHKDGGTTTTTAQAKSKAQQQEYGTDSYNRPGRMTGAIGPSRAGWPAPGVQKQQQHHQQQQQQQQHQQQHHHHQHQLQHQQQQHNHHQQRSPNKKQEQAMLKRHLFGLDNDMTSTTTRSLDLESILGGPWGTGQSVSDSETDTQGIRHIRSQLEGLENMYGEVLRMLGSRGGTGAGQPQRFADGNTMRGVGGMAARRRHGSLSSLPSSSVSGRPVQRDRRRTDDRRKVRDIKGINKRFQRLESHVVTLARSVAHLSSEMRSQHQVTQELERLRDELTALRSQSVRAQQMQHQQTASNEPEPPNLTNPRRVKKLTKFFGEDPPLMRLFLKNLGYEKYANLFEAERVGMIELPYLGEERLQKLGVPLGPRLRILQEAQISLCKDTTLCIV